MLSLSRSLLSALFALCYCIHVHATRRCVVVNVVVGVSTHTAQLHLEALLFLLLPPIVLLLL